MLRRSVLLSVNLEGFSAWGMPSFSMVTSSNVQLPLLLLLLPVLLPLGIGCSSGGDSARLGSGGV